MHPSARALLAIRLARCFPYSVAVSLRNGIQVLLSLVMQTRAIVLNSKA